MENKIDPYKTSAKSPKSVSTFATNSSLTGNRRIQSFKQTLSTITLAPARATCVVGHVAHSWIKRALGWSPRLLCGVGGVVLLARNWLLAYFNDLRATCSKLDWTGYAWTTCFIVFVLAEAFYFHGTNISLLLNSGLIANTSLSDSVDAMMARVKQQASTNHPADIERKQLASVEEPKNRRRHTLLEPPSAADFKPSKRPETTAENRQNTADLISSRSEKQTYVPVEDVPNSRQSNLSEPAKTALNSTPKTHLTIKWEN